MLGCKICRETFTDTHDLVAHLNVQHQVLPSERTVSGAHFARRRSDEDYDGRIALSNLPPEVERRRSHRSTYKR